MSKARDRELVAAVAARVLRSDPHVPTDDRLALDHLAVEIADAVIAFLPDVCQQCGDRLP